MHLHNLFIYSSHNNTLTGEVFSVIIIPSPTAHIISIGKGKCPVPIASDVIRGHTDTIILARLMQGDSYGYQINRDILQKTGKGYELKEATLYTAFRRLEKEGLIHSYWGEEGSGARRRYYSVTDAGREAYAQNLKDWQEAKKMIDALTACKEEE